MTTPRFEPAADEVERVKEAIRAAVPALAGLPLDAMARAAILAMDRRAKVDCRALAVEIVDAFHGYTFEFSSNPNSHREEYDTVEHALRHHLVDADPDLVPPLIRRASPTAEPEFYAYRWKIDGVYVKWRLSDASQRSEHLKLKDFEERPLYASPPAPAVAVKPLEWEYLDDTRSERASSSIGPYHIFPGAGFCYDLCGPVGGLLSTHKRVTEAQAAAQADYEQRTALVEPAPAVTEPCQTCQGNGEIVTDWDRYLHAHEGHAGDEAVAECPDCNGSGQVEPTPAVAEQGEIKMATSGKGFPNDPNNDPEKENIAPAPAVAVPEKWKLMPTRITEEMIAAAIAAHYGKKAMPHGMDITANGVNYSGAAAIRRFWKGLLAAAPEPPATRSEADIRNEGIEAAAKWRDIGEAKKDGTIIWALLRSDIYPALRPCREDLERWNGVQVPPRHAGVASDGFDIGWGIAAPVGHGGFPDDWIEGWIPLPAIRSLKGQADE